MRPARVEFREAVAFIAATHRHHAPPRGHRFTLGAEVDGKLVGVAVCGRPVARRLPQREVLEITRLATDGTTNACSFLYAACARVGREGGFRAVVTYTLATEPGTSLRAAGWWPVLLDEPTGAGDDTWDRNDRRRAVTKGQALGRKIRWMWLTGNDQG